MKSSGWACVSPPRACLRGRRVGGTVPGCEMGRPRCGGDGHCRRMRFERLDGVQDAAADGPVGCPGGVPNPPRRRAGWAPRAPPPLLFPPPPPPPPATTAATDPCAVNLAAPEIVRAVSELPRDPRSNQPWNPEPLAGNYNECAQ